jgi:hypothetical protein
MKLIMKLISIVLGALLVTSASLHSPWVSAQTNPPPSATATRPATTPSGQTSMPSGGPPATTTQTTGEVPRDPVVKKMNEEEKQKVNTEGK